MEMAKKGVGNYLHETIIQSGISQSAFYSAVEITIRSSMTYFPLSTIHRTGNTIHYA